MDNVCVENLDPRIRRTRQLLQQALEKLLLKKDFGEISVQDIADAATVNRVTFYDHYTDKSALLECVVGTRFGELIAERKICFEGTCSSALKPIVLAVCDYLGSKKNRRKKMEPHLESAVIAVVRRMLLEGLSKGPSGTPVPLEIAATTISWAIYGAAQEWLLMSHRPPSEEIAGKIGALVEPMLRVVHGA